MRWLFAGSRQILKLKDLRCYSRYSGAGREAFAAMDTENSVFTDTTRDFLAHFCSNLSSLSLTVPLFSPTCFLPPFLRHLNTGNSFLPGKPGPQLHPLGIPQNLPNPAHAASFPAAFQFLRLSSSLSLPLPSSFISLLLRTSFCHLTSVY